MAATFQPERPEEVANKVLRRAQVSKVRGHEINGDIFCGSSIY